MHHLSAIHDLPTELIDMIRFLCEFNVFIQLFFLKKYIYIFFIVVDQRC